MGATWHVGIEDQARLTAELAALDERLHELDERIRDAINRHRYGETPEETARGADDLRRFVGDLDRLMTRKRAVEAKFLLARRMAERAVAADRAPAATQDTCERFVVEVDRQQVERGSR